MVAFLAPIVAGVWHVFQSVFNTVMGVSRRSWLDRHRFTTTSRST